MPDLTPAPPSDAAPDPAARRKAFGELAVVFASSLVLTRVLSDLANVSAFFSEYLFTFVAAVFLVLPYLVLTRRRASFEAHAMTWAGWPRGLAWGLGLAAVTLVPFAIGYHLWQTDVLGHSFHPSTDNYVQLPLALEGRPAQQAQRGKPEFVIWRDGRDVTLQWSTPPRAYVVDIDLEAPGGVLTFGAGQHHIRDPEVRAVGIADEHVLLRSTTRGPTVRHATFRVSDSSTLAFALTADGKPVPADLIKIGPQRLPPDEAGAWDPARGHLDLDRSLSWLPLIILAQLLLIAFPEEFFYRGYLQTSLQRLFPRRFDVLWIHTSVAIIMTSALFALGHFVIDLRVSRLAVFFPSLLFGFLRDRTGTITSCIVYHAACNLMVEAISPHYLLG